VVTVAPTADPVPTTIGITFLPACAMEDVALPVDTLLVSGGADPSGGMTAAVSRWLRRATPQARRFGSVCTGAFALGAAGLLEGRRVTTHWLFAKALADSNPHTDVDADPIYIRDGNLYTSGGIAAGIDLGLALLQEDYGREFALAVSRHLVLFLKRSGDQAQFSTQLKAQFSELPAIQRVQSWCLDNLAGDLRVASLARQAAMSERNFVRIFRSETGQTPGEFVTTARLQAACRLLEDGHRSHLDVAKRSGFGSAAAMRRAFRHRLGVGPAVYREKFGQPPAPDRQPPAPDRRPPRPAKAWPTASHPPGE
jgi:transcriptional regulator GlxA family with amidase domain